MKKIKWMTRGVHHGFLELLELYINSTIEKKKRDEAAPKKLFIIGTTALTIGKFNFFRTHNRISLNSDNE